MSQSTGNKSPIKSNGQADEPADNVGGPLADAFGGLRHRHNRAGT
jgi:hypothetical protein